MINLNHLTVLKKRSQACLRMLCVYKSYIYQIYMYK